MHIPPHFLKVTLRKSSREGGRDQKFWPCDVASLCWYRRTILSGWSELTVDFVDSLPDSKYLGRRDVYVDGNHDQQWPGHYFGHHARRAGGLGRGRCGVLPRLNQVVSSWWLDALVAVPVRCFSLPPSAPVW